jgi:hypothetical protein
MVTVPSIIHAPEAAASATMEVYDWLNRTGRLGG